MKLSILILLLSLAVAPLFSQEGWYLGANASAFHYWMYNRHDFNETPRVSTNPSSDYVYPVHPKILSPRGFCGGISGGYKWWNGVGIGFGFVYATQQQKFIREHRATSTLWKPEDNVFITDRLDYLQLPVHFEWSIGEDDGLKLIVKGGVVYSWLASSMYDQYSGGPEMEEYFHVKLKNKQLEHIGRSEPSNLDYHLVAQLDGDYLSRHVLGGFAELGLELPLSKKWAIQVGFMGNYDFTNTERYKDFKENYFGSIPVKNVNLISGHYPGLENYSYDRAMRWGYHQIIENDMVVGLEPRPRTHNIRAGVTMELRYYFNRY